ncbi:MAG: hypothetical protein Q9162_005709 [Coniocarpon cinnabarinum]
MSTAGVAHVLRQAALLHPTESLFIPAFVLSVAQILINITEYGLSPGKTGIWLLSTMTVFYWLYMVLAICFSVGIYLMMWSTQTFTLSAMTPIWIFPAYPLLLVGPFAGALSQALVTDTYSPGPSTAKSYPSPNSRLHVLVGGVICQGLGFLLSMQIYAAFLYRLMTHKLPTESTRPGMFVSVGPSGFTVSALIQMGAHFPTVVPAEFMGNGELAGQVTKIIAYWAGLWLYGLAVWFFLVSTFAHWSCVGGQRLTFAMTWYAFIFPNTSLITSTFNVARALGENKPIQVVGCVMTCVLIVVWSFIIGMNIRAIALKQVLWPQNGEDASSHIFKGDGERRKTREDGVAGGHGSAWATGSRAVVARVHGTSSRSSVSNRGAHRDERTDSGSLANGEHGVDARDTLKPHASRRPPPQILLNAPEHHPHDVDAVAEHGAEHGADGAQRRDVKSDEQYEAERERQAQEDNLDEIDREIRDDIDNGDEGEHEFDGGSRRIGGGGLHGGVGGMMGGSGGEGGSHDAGGAGGPAGWRGRAGEDEGRWKDEEDGFDGRR